MELKVSQNRSSRTLMVGYILLFLATLGLDQTTKFHAQQQFMSWSHETDLQWSRWRPNWLPPRGLSAA